MTAFPPQITLAAGHLLTYLSTLTLIHAFEPNYNLFKEERIKGGRKLETLLVSANTDIVMSEMASEVEGFPPVLCILWMNESHTIAVADKLRRYKDTGFRRNKNDWLAHTNKWLPLPPLGVGCYSSWNSISERMKLSEKKERAGREKKHKDVDWLRAGCLISRPIMIGWEVWPHLKIGLLQFNDTEISIGISMCWCGWKSIFTARTRFSNQPQTLELVQTSVCAFVIIHSLYYTAVFHFQKIFLKVFFFFIQQLIIWACICNTKPC